MISITVVVPAKNSAVNNITFRSHAEKVSIDQNITGLIGNNDIPLTCSFIIEAWENMTRVELFAKNKTDEFIDVKPIAIFKPNEPAKLISAGSYLSGRVTLTNITSTSTNATLTFHVLKCEDEKDYMCKCYYTDMEGASLPTEKSPPTRISVQKVTIETSISATAARPGRISSIIVSSTKTEIQGLKSSICNTSLSTKKNDILTIPTSPIDTVTITHLQSTENLQFVFREDDTIMFTCSGNIGNPPGKLIWQKTFPQEKKPITYSNETTYIEEIPGKCSFKGTSHLTVKIYAEDIKAKIRCFEESQVNVPGMYIETEPFDVHFHVRHTTIHMQPKQERYDKKINKITLTCSGSGNPEPTYIWFKEDNKRNILSRTNLYVIEDVVQNNSGVYICEANNLIDDINYRQTNSVNIYIEHATIIVISGICAVVIIILTCCAVKKGYCSRPNRHESDNAIYDEVKQQANLEYKLTNLHTLVPTENVVYDDVSMESSMNYRY
ncbi:CADM3 [Mytilus coruscus]|uniref:CADM3 n=1 Tax=Mytilus coruscus TaxID=42192 RepID=A0A6J8EXJ6_MYTCO|nr:CADM3 [Mytilus coruscus]